MKTNKCKRSFTKGTIIATSFAIMTTACQANDSDMTGSAPACFPLITQSGPKLPKPADEEMNLTDKYWACAKGKTKRPDIVDNAIDQISQIDTFEIVLRLRNRVSDTEYSQELSRLRPSNPPIDNDACAQQINGTRLSHHGMKRLRFDALLAYATGRDAVNAKDALRLGEAISDLFCYANALKIPTADITVSHSVDSHDILQFNKATSLAILELLDLGRNHGLSPQFSIKSLRNLTLVYARAIKADENTLKALVNTQSLYNRQKNPDGEIKIIIEASIYRYALSHTLFDNEDLKNWVTRQSLN